MQWFLGSSDDYVDRRYGTLPQQTVSDYFELLLNGTAIHEKALEEEPVMQGATQPMRL